MSQRYVPLKSWRYDRDPDGEPCVIVVTKDDDEPHGFIYETACCETWEEAQQWIQAHTLETPLDVLGYLFASAVRGEV